MSLTICTDVFPFKFAVNFMSSLFPFDSFFRFLLLIPRWYLDMVADITFVSLVYFLDNG